jgi:flagellar motor protein MotB
VGTWKTRLERRLRTFLAISLLPIVGVTGAITAPSAVANPVACSATGAAQSQLKVVPSHGKAFYIDSGVNPKLDAGYVGYRVDNDSTVARSGLWVALTNFTGGKLNLVNSADQYMPLEGLGINGSGASNEIKTVYFMLKATGPSTVAHTHDVTIYDRRPDLQGAVALYSCRYTFSAIKETIKAAANKVGDNGATANGAISVSNSSPTLGETVVVTVEGSTGQIGAGGLPDYDIIWLTPAAISTWPTRALRLRDVSITFDGNGNWGTSNDRVQYDDLLLISATNGLSNVDQSDYVVRYTFEVIGRPPGTVKAVPVAQIASGTQVKHSDVSASGATADITFPAFSTSLKVEKSVVSLTNLETTTISSTQYVAIPYRLTVSSSSSTPQVIDEVIDVPPAAGIFKAGSASPLTDPTYLAAESGLSPRPLHFVGPFTVRSGSPQTINYKIWVPNVSDTYTNTAYVQVGDLKIGSTASAIPKVNVRTNGTTTVSAETTTQTIGPVVTTVPASSVETKSATLNASVDANGTAGTLKFRYGTNSSLAAYTEVTASTPASGGFLVSDTDPKNGLVNVTNLSPGTTYFFQALMGDVLGEILSFTTPAITAPPTLQVRPASGVGASNATLNGQINPNNTYVYGVRFSYSTNFTFTTKTSVLTTGDGNVEVGGSSLQDFSLSVTGLAATTTYYYKIEACTTTPFNASTCTWLTSPDSATFTTGRTGQTINYDPTPSKTYGDSTFMESASATSGLPVTYTSLTTSVCQVSSGGVVTIVGVGECSIEASQSGNGSFNPAPTVVNSFVVNPKTLLVTATDRSKTYGASSPTFTSTLSGFVGSDAATLASANYEFTGISPTVYSRSTSVPSSAGSYNTIPSSALLTFSPIAAGNNYVLSYVNGTYTINKATLTISVNSQTILETESPTPFVAHIDGLAASDSASIISFSRYFTGKAPTSLSRTTDTPVARGSYFVNPETATVAFTEGSAENYLTSYQYSPGTFVIRASSLAPQVITLSNGSIVYGNTIYLPSLLTRNDTGTGTISYSIAAGDSSRCSLSSGDLKETLTALSGTGTCTVTAFKSGDDTYDSATATATITLTLAPRTHSFAVTSYTLTYGASQTVSASPQFGSGTITYALSASPGCSITGASVTALIASGTCTVNSTVASDGNYEIANTSTPVTITLAPASLTVKADDKSKTEGASDPSFTAAITSAFQNSDSANVTTFTPSFSAASNCSGSSTSVPTAVGIHYICPTSGGTTLTFNPGSSESYTVTFQSGTYTINALNRTANSITMDTATVVFQATLNLLDLVDTTTASTGAISFTSDNVDCVLSGTGNHTLTADSGTGTCTITVTQAQDPTFQSASANAIITLAKKDQTISFTTPTDMTVGAGSQNLNVNATSSLTIAMTVNSGTICSQAALVVSAIAQGTCSLTANQAGNNNWNAAAPVTRTFQISPAPADQNNNSGGSSGPTKLNPKITWEDPADIFSPTPLGAIQLNAVGSVPGTLVYTPAAGTVLPVGRHTLSVTLNPTDSQTYNSVSTTVRIRVLEQRFQTALTWSNPASIVYPTPLSRTQLNARANTPGSFTYDPAIGTVLDPGTHVLNVNFQPTFDRRYQPASTQVSIVVTTSGVSTPVTPTPQQPIVVDTRPATTPSNASNPTPSGPANPRILIDTSIVNSVTITDKGPGVTAAQVKNDRIEVATAPTFSGKTSVEVTYVQNSDTRVVVVPLVIPPAPPAIAASTPQSMESSTIRWEASPNAISYDVFVRDNLECQVRTTSCEVPFIVGPTTPIRVVVIGGDATKVEVTPVFKQERVIPALTVNFATASSRLNSAFRQELREIAEIVEREGFTSLVVYGHTDSRAFDNRTLSRQRAEATRDFLKKLLPDVEFKIAGFAATQRVAEENTRAGLAQNRRAEVRIAG